MKTIRLGDTGDDVKKLQTIIQTLITGKFNDVDEIVVKEHQEKLGLKVDGIVGPITWAALLTENEPKPPVDGNKPTELKKQDWPTQANCDDYYGNPRKGSSWEIANLVKIVPPWKMIDEDSKRPVTSFKMHKKVEASLNRIFNKIWETYGKSQEEIEKHGLHVFSGSYVFRNIRGGSHLSMHSYGIALDIASQLNDLGKPYDPKHGIPMEVVKMFEAEGWTWGGRWTGRPDAMHFQAASVR